MMAVVEPGRVDEFLAVCAKWDVRAAVIGEVTDTGRLLKTWHGETVVDIPPASAADGPVYERPLARPASKDALAADDWAALPRPADGAGLRADLLALLGSPGLADKSWVTDQYDRYVRGDTVLAMPEDAGLLRVDEATGLGIALATDGNGRYCRLDPYLGTQLALSEACRNVAATGARPLAVTNCLNFGSPEDTAVMWQFAEAVRGLADGCAILGVPVTGGNVSFYNQTGAEPAFGRLAAEHGVPGMTIGTASEGRAGYCSFEVIAGKAIPATGRASCFGYVQTIPARDGLAATTPNPNAACSRCCKPT